MWFAGAECEFGWGDQQMILAFYNNIGHIHADCNTQETQLCIGQRNIFLAQ
jgi:hypothetical protein